MNLLAQSRVPSLQQLQSVFTTPAAAWSPGSGEEHDPFPVQEPAAQLITSGLQH